MTNLSGVAIIARAKGRYSEKFFILFRKSLPDCDLRTEDFFQSSDFHEVSVQNYESPIAQ